MKVNTRMFTVQQADNEIRAAIYAKQEEHGLTDIELLQCLAETQQSVLKYMLRAERHDGRIDIGADELPEEEDDD